MTPEIPRVRTRRWGTGGPPVEFSVATTGRWERRRSAGGEPCRDWPAIRVVRVACPAPPEPMKPGWTIRRGGWRPAAVAFLPAPTCPRGERMSSSAGPTGSLRGLAAVHVELAHFDAEPRPLSRLPGEEG